MFFFINNRAGCATSVIISVIGTLLLFFLISGGSAPW